MKKQQTMSVEDYEAAVRATWTEKDFQKQVVALARRHGWKKIAHFCPGRAPSGRWLTAMLGDKGFPDNVFLRGESHRLRLVVAELKVGKNRPTPEQLEWLALFHEAGVTACVWRPEMWNRIVEVLSSP